MGKVAEAMRAKLLAALTPTKLEIEDDSARHSGHSGAREGGESHFNVSIESAAFADLRPVERQRLVHKILSEELAGPVHALSLKLSPSSRAG